MHGSRPHVVVVVGNGLSRDYDDERFELRALTRRVRAAVSELAARGTTEYLLAVLERIRQSMSHDLDLATQDGKGSFEELAGPVQRALHTLDEVCRIVPDAGRGTDSVRASLADFNRQLVGAVMQDLDEGAERNRGGDERIARFANFVVDVSRHFAVEMFTLNYDRILDRHLLGASRRDGAPRDLVKDTFSPHPIDVRVGPVVVRGFPLRDERPPTRRFSINLTHLHGAWNTVRTGDQVVKIPRPTMLNHDVLQGWVRGERSYGDPVVLLTDQKGRITGDDPFARHYASLSSALVDPDIVVIAGYGFGDTPLNEALSARPAGVPTVAVTGPGSSDSRRFLARIGGEVMSVEKGVSESVSDLRALIREHTGVDVGSRSSARDAR